MFSKKQGFPENDELVLCTVTAVQHNCVFAVLDEYNRQGMIHISEISPGRIRNIRDFVVEGRKIVCKVLNINRERGHIDLSLRRVNESQRRLKLDELKLEQKAEKMLEIIATKMKIDVKGLYDTIMAKIAGKYSTLYSYFEDIALNGLKMDIDIDAKVKKELLELISLKIKPVEVEVKGNLSLKSYASDGVEVIKKSLKKSQEIGGESLSVTYKGGGQYWLTVKSIDYKKAEKIIRSAAESAIAIVEKNNGSGSFEKSG